jgi:pSer/pThr/pTyr-binding forkhead associated (FHA) protein
MVIGRTADNDLQVDSKIVSRHHCQITTSLEGSTIEDLNSTNGIYLKGRRIRRHKFSDGDMVKIGMHELTYQRLDHVEDAEDVAANDDDEAANVAAAD